jgi:release factor glutamine methyltransferase
VRALLDEIAAMLAESGRLDPESRADARREARLIAAGILGCSPGEVAQRIDRTLPVTQVERMRAAAARRAGGEPLAYCVGSAPFRHLVLAVDARVLIPRPETETLVEEVLRLTAARPGGIAVDVGTGSGAIALALASEGRFERVIATDVSLDALEVARANADRLPQGSAPVEFRAGTDLAPVDGISARVIVSNPPYISFQEARSLPSSVRDWEPSVALFAADGGMARYDALFGSATRCLEPGGWLALEVDATRARDTQERAERAGFRDVRLVPDLSGRARVLLARAGGASDDPRRDL